MNKTPIMILQELAVKEGVTPKYDVIYSQSGTHVNRFTYRVAYDNLYADATASNKKEAKQNAAQNMLKLLQEEKKLSSKGFQTLEWSKLPLSSSTATFLNITNYVGLLQEYCLQRKFVQPEYRLDEIEGPAHSVKFKMSCTLGSITEEAVASTKKQVKQLVAQKVLQKLPNIKNNSQYQVSDNNSSQTETIEDAFTKLGIKMADLEITKSIPVKDIKVKYLNAVSKEDLLPLVNLNEKMSIFDCHLHFKIMILNSICNGKKSELDALYNTFKEYIEKNMPLEKNTNNLVACTQILKYIKTKYNLSIKRISLFTKTNMTVIGFRINLTIPLVQFGISYDPASAEQEALTKIIEAIILYLK